MTDKRTVESLLFAWAEAKAAVAGEFSSNLIASYKEITAEAKAYADDLDIEWDDEIIPVLIREAIEADHEFWKDLDERGISE